VNIWLVNPFDALPGEQLRSGRYAFFAQMLMEAGHEVTWWTSDFFHFTKSYRDPSTWAEHLPAGMAVHLAPAPPYYQNVSARRLYSHYTWSRNFYRDASAAEVRPDVIIASSPPLSGADQAIRMGNQLGAKVIVDVQDLWPEAFRLGFPGPARWAAQPLLWPLTRLADANYRRADGLTAICQALLDRALAADPQKGLTRLIPLGVDVQVYERAVQAKENPWQKPNHEFWVVYIGTIGKTYDVGTILETAHTLGEEQPSIKFIVAGRGPLLERSQDRARELGLSNLVFVGHMALEDLAQLLVQADVGLNAVAHGAVAGIPNKFFDYVAAGLPVINSMGGELEVLIREEDLGLPYEAGRVESLRDAILNLYEAPETRAAMGARGRQLSRERYDRRVAYAAMLELVDKVAMSG
jgi:glycosyltransferase involved in cell wall biosynthesis